MVVMVSWELMEMSDVPDATGCSSSLVEARLQSDFQSCGLDFESSSEF
jgi:hypothetical protein